MSLVLFHTAEVNRALFDALLAEQNTKATSVLRGDLLDRSTEAGRFIEGLRSETRAAMRDALRLAGPDARLLCTCSTIGPAADDLSTQGLPVTRVDRALAEQALDRGPRIAVLYTLATTHAPTLNLFEAVAGTTGQDADIRMICVEGAWDLFLAGNMDAYQAAIAGTVDNLPDTFDAIALAQATMHGAAALTGREVLTSPVAGLTDILQGQCPP